MMQDLDELGDRRVPATARHRRAWSTAPADYSADPRARPRRLAGRQAAAHRLRRLRRCSPTSGDVDTGDPQLLADFITHRHRRSTRPTTTRWCISDHGASWPGVGGDESADNDGARPRRASSAASSAGLDGAGVEQARPARVRRLPDGHLRGGQRDGARGATACSPRRSSSPATAGTTPPSGCSTPIPTADVDALGSALIDGFEQQAEGAGDRCGDHARRSSTWTRWRAVDGAMADFAGVLADRAAALGATIGQTPCGRARLRSQPRPGRGHADGRPRHPRLRDRRRGARRQPDQADALIRAIDDAVLDSVTGRRHARGHGHVDLLPARGPVLYDEDYASVSQRRGWTEFLDAYYDAGAAIPEDQQPQFENLEGEATVELRRRRPVHQRHVRPRRGGQPERPRTSTTAWSARTARSPTSAASRR